MYQEDLRKLSQKSVNILKEQAYYLNESDIELNIIAESIGLSQDTVSKWLTANNISDNSNLTGELLNDVQTIWPESLELLQRQVSNLYKKQFTISEIANLTGLQENWITANLPKDEKNNNQKHFYQINPAMDIKLDQHKKIIKSKDAYQYYSSMTLLQDMNILSKSKKKAYKEALESAKKIGYIQGKGDANKYLSQRNIEFTENINTYLAEVESKLSNIIYSLVQKIIEDYDDIDYVTRNINSALKNLRNNQKITLHVHSDLIQEVSSHLKASDNSTINIISDNSLDKKDCVLITEVGVINSCLKNQLAILSEYYNTKTATTK